MARQIIFEPDLNICFVYWSGDVTIEDGHTFFNHIVCYSWFAPGVKILHDFRTARLRVNVTDVIKLVGFFNLIKQGFGAGRAAAIMRNGAGMKLAQAYVSLGSEKWRPLRAFLSFEEAREWLDLPAGYADPFADTSALPVQIGC